MNIGHTILVFAGCGLALTLNLPPAAAYTALDVDHGATVRAKVTFAGELAEPEGYYMQKNPRVCGQAQDAKDGTRFVSFVRTSRGNLDDVVVFLDGVEKGKPFPSEMGEFSSFRSQSCTWGPRVGVFVNGDAITVTNSDPVAHNPIGYETVGRARLNHFNLPLSGEGDTLREPVTLRKGQFLKLECLQHQFMHSWVFAVTSPYFSLTRSTGAFEIEKIPPGNYTVNAWHPTLGLRTRPVTLAENQELEVTFEFN